MTLASSNSTSLGIGTQQNLPLNFLVGNSVRATIYPDGNVGIGTTTNNVLDQTGAARPLLIQSGSNSTTLGGSTNALVISNSDTTANNSSQLNFAAITGANVNQFTTAIIAGIHGARTNGQYPAGALAFLVAPGSNVAPVERLRIDSSGNVGIGLSNAGYPLTIQANASTGALRLVGRAADDVSTLEFGNSTQLATNAIIQSGPGYLSFGPSGAEQARVDNTGAFRFNSGYGSAAIAYGCRAVANFSGVPLNGTYSRGGTLITVTMTAHGMTTGQRVELDFTTGAGTDGSYIVTVVDANTFTLTDTASGTTSGNVTRLTWLRYGGNIARVEKVSTGRYRLTFSTAMPTRTYVVNSSASADNVAMNAVVPMVWGDTRLTTSFEIGISDNNTDTGPFDYPQIDISVFR
jgi:hypothetical protein